jgi:phosphatidylethanolamine/phosphatidyl-N-methylethanolamine N-methyltransferase
MPQAKQKDSSYVALLPKTRGDAMWQKWQEDAPRIYDKIYYESNPLVAHINNSGHRFIEKPFDESTHFGRVLEVGAGTGHHMDYVRHSYDEYVLSDISDDLLAKARMAHGDKEKLTFEIADATNLPYEDNSFDRLVSVYNLEHLPAPHEVLQEWARVVKPNGVISIAIPTEGSLAWNTGRYLTSRRSFKKEGLNLDYIIAREHINAGYRLISLIKHYFPNMQDHWYPMRLPLHHVNLVYSCTITLKGDV